MPTHRSHIAAGLSRQPALRDRAARELLPTMATSPDTHSVAPGHWVRQDVGTLAELALCPLKAELGKPPFLRSGSGEGSP